MGIISSRNKDLYQATSDAVEGFFGGKNIAMKLSQSTLTDAEHASLWRGNVSPSGVIRTPPNGGWDWATLVQSQYKNPKKFCVSVFDGNQSLCGLFQGGISKGGEVVSLSYVESAHYKTDLSSHVRMVALTFTIQLAEFSNAKFAAVYQPNENMTNVITNMGFFEGQNIYGTRKKTLLNPYYFELG
ncbi:hypothetical protein [Aeromonas veronii]